MKKSYIFSFLIVLVSAVLLAGCDKIFLITAPQDAPEYYMQILDSKDNKDITYYEGSGYKVTSGKTVKITVSFKEGWDPTQATLFGGDKQLILTKDTAFSESEVWFAELKIDSNIKLEVRNLVKKVYTVTMPNFPEKSSYLFYNETTPITAETLTVKHGDDLSITIYPQDGYALPPYLPYQIGNVFSYENSMNNASYAETDLYENPIFYGSGLKYKFSNITSNFAIGLSSSYMPDGDFVKKVFLDLESNSEYSLIASIYDEYIDDDGNLHKGFKNFDNLRNQTLYIGFDSFGNTSDYVQNLMTKSLLIKTATQETWEIPIETVGEYKDYFIIPAEKVKSDLSISLKQKAIDDNNLDVGKYYGTFNNKLSNQIPYKLAFTNGYVYGLECYNFEEKIYLTAGDTLFIPRMYGDNFTLTTTNITLNKEMYKSSEYQEDYDYTKYTVESIEANDFTIELSTSSVVTIPYADLKDDFIIEYRIGYDTTLPFIEITNESASIITVNNLQSLIIKLTSKHNEPFWANFDLSVPAYIHKFNLFMSQDYLYCKVEEGFGLGSQIYPKDGIYFYTVTWFTGDTNLSAR